MKQKIDDEIREMTPEEYTAYHKAKMYNSLASNIGWVCFFLCCVCCHYCNK